MSYHRIEDIEGIGSVYAEKLRAAGISSVQGLLKKGADPTGRKAIADTTGLDSKKILSWVNMADLFRVKGVGSEYAELLEKAGVDTVKELRTRNPENLFAKMKSVNSAGRPLVRSLPGLKNVESWVKHAQQLKPRITY